MNIIILLYFTVFTISCKSDPVVYNETKSELKSTQIYSNPSSESKDLETNPKKDDHSMVDHSKNETAKKEIEKDVKNKEVKKEIPKETVEKIIQQAKPKVSATTSKPKQAPPTLKKPSPKPVVIVEEKPKVFYPDTIHNYGFINEGDTIIHSFRFLNDGKEDLEILDVQVSCGCTIPKYPLTGIKPGRLGKIEVTFLSTGKIGSQLATIDVLTNAENPRQTLYLKGVVR